MMVAIIKSETFYSHDIDLQSKILNDTISDFFIDIKDIINIQFKEGEDDGMMRFIIYVKKIYEDENA